MNEYRAEAILKRAQNLLILQAKNKPLILHHQGLFVSGRPQSPPFITRQ